MDNSVVVKSDNGEEKDWCFADSNIYGNMQEVARYVASLMYEEGITEIDIKIKKER